MSMTLVEFLDEVHLDQLKELINLAMGDGAKALSAVTSRFIQLSVPHINQHRLETLAKPCKFLQDKEFYCCAQQFICLGQSGWFFVLLNQKDLASYAALLDRDCLDDADHENILLQMVGVIAPVLLPRLAKELGVSLKLGEVHPYQRVSSVPLMSNSSDDALNLMFSYAVEVPLVTSEEEPEAIKLPPVLALDVVLRAPTGLLKQLAEKFASRFDAHFSSIEESDN
jgi:hypothetical protein